MKCELKPEEVLAKYLVCPVNPADINVLQGTYPIRPPLPATGGGEGVAEVVAAGSASHLQPGDWVLPARPMTGTWRSHAVTTDDNWIKIRNDIPAISAATMMVNPCTALRMLLDFVPLSPGAWVIQNGANSGAGSHPDCQDHGGQDCECGEGQGEYQRVEGEAEQPWWRHNPDGGGAESLTAVEGRRAGETCAGAELCGRAQQYRAVQGSGRRGGACHLWGHVKETCHGGNLAHDLQGLAAQRVLDGAVE